MTSGLRGKTTTAAWAVAHAMVFYPGSLSVIGQVHAELATVGGGVSEMRIDYGPGYRVYFVRGGRRL